jgi:hypothetical protein
MRTFEILAVVVASTLLSACKNDNADAPLTLDAAAPVPTPVMPPSVMPPSVMPPPTPTVVPHPAAPKGTVATGGGAALPGTGTLVDAGASDVTAPPADAGGASGKLAACFQKCQGILASCATPTFPADGGLPQIKDPKACEAAFETCRAACAP